jgi:dolichyl-phosphate-mannose-protein mannosyltransferase
MATVVAAAEKPSRSRAHAFVRREWALLLSGFIWALLVLNFNRFAIATGDESVQYGFVRRLYGDSNRAVGYFFGLGLIEAPFYGIGKALEVAGVTTVAGHPTREAAVTTGLVLLTLTTWPLLASIIRSLGLSLPGPAILLAALGTPLFFYSSFEPAKNHAQDAVLFTVVVYLTFRYFRDEPPSRWLPVLIGVTLGLSMLVRYTQGAEALALVACLLWLRRWRAAAEVVAGAAVTVLVLVSIPLALHVPLRGGGYSESLVHFHPLNPFRMLFTDHRGYFVWSPVAIFGALGIARLFRSRPRERTWLSVIVLMAAAVVVSYTAIGYWDGTWALGQRFFTPFFPLVAIGLAGLFDVKPWRKVSLALATVAACWSLLLVFNFTIIGGPQYLDTVPGGASDLALLPTRTHQSLGSYLWGLRHKSNFLRWTTR